MKPEPSGQHVQSLARGLAVIRAFGSDHPRMTLSEIAGITGLTRATSRRFLLTLLELGYVSTDGKYFQLTPRVLELGFSYLSGLSIPEIAQPHLESLSRLVGESTSASVLDGDHIVYIARVPTRRIMNVGITIGTRFPAGKTSMGRVLLAAQPQAAWPAELAPALMTVRDQGWALVDQELEAGIRSVAAPLRGATGEVVAAINVSSTTSSASLERLRDEFVPALLATADEITRALAQVGGRT
jgi:IclR family pca regulon transcriptional regulator